MHRLQDTGRDPRETDGLNKAPGPLTIENTRSQPNDTRYRGRFAPSPTGPLHFGSLVAALGSYLDARSQGGEWLVRIEDIDGHRSVPDAASGILRTLESFGFAWDGPVLHQGRRSDLYREASAGLLKDGWAYPCACSRRDVAEIGRPGADGPVYPGTCRAGLGNERPGRSLRVRTKPIEVAVHDRIQGRIYHQIERDVGDFILHRADGMYAYQLAVVVDDALQAVTQVVRGADLLLSTPRQVYLQRLLSFSTPHYAHLPVAVDESGHKLSKSAAAAPVEPNNPLPALLAALRFLGQAPPLERPTNLDEFWTWAIGSWNPDRIPRQTTRPLSEAVVREF